LETDGTHISLTSAIVRVVNVIRALYRDKIQNDNPQ